MLYVPSSGLFGDGGKMRGKSKGERERVGAFHDFPAVRGTAVQGPKGPVTVTTGISSQLFSAKELS